VTGANGENRLYAEGATQSEAWWRACEQAAAVGMLALPRCEPGAHAWYQTYPECVAGLADALRWLRALAALEGPGPGG
jgi:hypothetical protein